MHYIKIPHSLCYATHNAHYKTEKPWTIKQPCISHVCVGHMESHDCAWERI